MITIGTHHDDATVKRFSSHTFSYNVFTSKGTNALGGVLIAIHKSIQCRRRDEFNHIDNLIVLGLGAGPNAFQLVTCYSPPTEQIPLEIFDCILDNNSNTIFTGDFNAKHKSWSSSMENQKGHSLFSWLSSSGSHTSLKILSSHHKVPVKRTSWKALELLITFVGNYWEDLAEQMAHSTTFYSLYERFLSLCLARLTIVTYCNSFKTSLPHHIVKMIEQKRMFLKAFRRTRHPFFALMLRSMSKHVQKALFLYKRQAWLKYCISLNSCDTKLFWPKIKRHFKSGSVAIDGFKCNNNIIVNPAEMCSVA